VVLELGRAAVLPQLESLDDVRDGTAHEAEVHGVGRLEADGLDRRRHERAHGREVRGEDEVLAALEHAQLALERARGTTQVGRRDHVEDDLARRVDPDGERPERPERPAEAEIERERSTHAEDVDAEADRGHGACREPASRCHAAAAVWSTSFARRSAS